MANNKITAFTATTTAAQIVPASPFRKVLRIQNFGPPDQNGNVTVWADDTGNAAVVNQCYQVISGGVVEWINGGQLPWVYCPTGAVSVITSSGTAMGIIEEIV